MQATETKSGVPMHKDGGLIVRRLIVRKQLSPWLWLTRERETRALSEHNLFHPRASASLYIITSFCFLCISIFSASFIPGAKYTIWMSKNDKRIWCSSILWSQLPLDGANVKWSLVLVVMGLFPHCLQGEVGLLVRCHVVWVSRPVVEAPSKLQIAELLEERQAHTWNSCLSPEEAGLAFPRWRDSI